MPFEPLPGKGVRASAVDIADSNLRDAALNHGEKEKEAKENRH